MTTIKLITKCRARETVYVGPDDTKPECEWVPDSGGQPGYSCTKCGRFVDAKTDTGRALSSEEWRSRPLNLQTPPRSITGRDFAGSEGTRA